MALFFHSKLGSKQPCLNDASGDGLPGASVSIAHDDGEGNTSIDLLTGAVVGNQKSKEERRFVAKLDIFLLVYCCFTQVIKGLDQQNISAAYVSGMKEDLDIQQNEYNLFITYFNLGYCLFVIPSQIVMTYVRPSWWLPGLEFCWGILTLAVYRVKTVQQLYVIRAFIGLFEGSSFSGGVTLLMTWYTPRELAFRIGFFQTSQYIGSMMSGGLQAAIYRGLNGKGGLAGWRWMFLIDGIITLVVAAAGFFCIPDFPSKPNKLAFWVGKSGVELAQDRAQKFRRTDTKRFDLSTLRQATKGPLIYMIPILYVAAMLAQQGYQYFNLFLKSLRNTDGTAVWNVEKVNAIPIGGFAIACVSGWVFGYISDRTRSRWTILLVLSCIGLIPAIIMSIWTVPLSAKYASYFMSYVSVVTSPTFFAWLSDMTPHTPQERALIVGLCVAGFYSQNTWANVLIWPAKKAPHYPFAWQVSVGLWCFYILDVLALRFVELKYLRPRNIRIAEEKEHAAGSTNGERRIEDAEGDKSEIVTQTIRAI